MEMMNSNERNWCSFIEARTIVHALGLKSRLSWQSYCKSGEKPIDIPTNPDKVYGIEFKGYGDWLGTGTVASFRRTYRSFSEARTFVQTLGLRNTTQWRDYCKSGKKPKDIPTMPERYKEFKGYGDWLGTGNVAPTKRTFLPYTEARTFARSLKLRNQDAWLAYGRSGQRPANIPANPDSVYLDVFESYGDWLGTGNLSNRMRTYRPFIEARAFVHTLGFLNSDQWYAYCKSGEKPSDIPSHPDQVHHSQYKDMGDWLGTGRTRHFRSFLEARAFARTLGLTSYRQWTEYCQSGKKPADIPADPGRTYATKYKNIDDWLGTEYLPFSEARAFAQTLNLENHDQWLAFCRSGKKPMNVPSKPEAVYREAYKGIKDWLGVEERWNRGSLLTFLQELQPSLIHLDKKTLVSILRRERAFPAFCKVLGGVTEKRVLHDLIDSGGKNLEQAIRALSDDQAVVNGSHIGSEIASGMNSCSTENLFSANEEIDVPALGEHFEVMSNPSLIVVDEAPTLCQERGQQKTPLDPYNPIEQARELLLLIFDNLSTASDAQGRGYQLQELLNHLFHLYKIPVRKSFTRNNRGEQIDGAFSLNHRHYLAECRWREKLADIRQLDGLLGQVGRSGSQAMGLFLSINGWSGNVCPLLKQNPHKSIILMDGDDLRGILSGQASLHELLELKAETLSFDSEPFFSLSQYLQKKGKASEH